MRTYEAPTITKTPQDKLAESVETHPAYAQIGANRVNGGAFLYGSDFQHHGYVTITIYRSQVRRGLSNDWPFASLSDELIEVALSEAQWATFVSTLNSGMGTQCTLQAINNEPVPQIQTITDRKSQFKGEHAAAFERAFAALGELRALIDDLKVSEKTKDLLRDRVRVAEQDWGVNADFVKNQFGEHVEKTTERAKTEAHAYLQGLIQRAGLQQLLAPQTAIDPGKVLPE